MWDFSPSPVKEKFLCLNFYIYTDSRASVTTLVLRSWRLIKKLDTINSLKVSAKTESSKLSDWV